MGASVGSGVGSDQESVGSGVGRIFQATPSFLLFSNWLRSLVSRVSGNSYLIVHRRARGRAGGRAGARAMCRGIFSRHSRHSYDTLGKKPNKIKAYLGVG